MKLSRATVSAGMTGTVRENALCLHATPTPSPLYLGGKWFGMFGLRWGGCRKLSQIKGLGTKLSGISELAEAKLRARQV